RLLPHLPAERFSLKLASRRTPSIPVIGLRYVRHIRQLVEGHVRENLDAPLEKPAPPGVERAGVAYQYYLRVAEQDLLLGRRRSLVVPQCNPSDASGRR